MSHIYIDADVECERPHALDTMACKTNKVRHSPGHQVQVPDTQMTVNNGTAPAAFLASVPWLASSYHPGNKSPIENYLADPARGIEGEGTTLEGITDEYTKLAPKVFAQRLALVINTAMRVSYYTPAVLGFSKANLTAMESRGEGVKYANTTGEFTTMEERYQIHEAWMAVYVLSICLMGLCILTTILLTLGTKSPDFLTSVSALTRDSVHVQVPAGGSTCFGDERARLLKNRRLIIRDVQPGDEIGHIALADDSGYEGKQGLKAGERLYA